MLLWEKGSAPLFNREYGQDEPYIETWLLKDGETHPCVVVIPGGGYAGVAYEHEGRAICDFLNKYGYSAVMLMYRVYPYSYPVPQIDAKRAVRLVRQNAQKWNIDPQKIGVIGFSAGAHLAMCTALDFDNGIDSGDNVDAVSSRPDYAALCYGVLSLDPAITHMGTRINFLGNGDPILAEVYSGENMMRKDAPPFFLWHTATDNAVPVACSLRFANRLIESGSSCTLHVYPEGVHGLGLAEKTPLANRWGEAYIDWLNYICRN